VKGKRHSDSWNIRFYQSPERQMPALLVGQTRWAFVLDKVYKRQVHGAEHSLVQFYEVSKSRWVAGT
jgi:elongation factor P--beta-lysine ligase